MFSPGHEDPPVYICESQLPEGGSDSDEEAQEELQDLHDMLLQNASFAQFWVRDTTQLGGCVPLVDTSKFAC